MDARVRMAALTSVTGAFRARVLAARLESEGIASQLRGAIDGPYNLTMGDMARVDVYVPEDQLDDARLVMLVDEVEATLAAPSEWWNAGDEPRRRSIWPLAVALALLATALLAPLVYVVSR